jgi:hypothetical protein
MSDGTDAERRLRRLEILADLSELLAKYAFNADIPGRGRDWVALWTADGVMDTGAKVCRGHDELYAFITAPGSPSGRSHHHPGEPAVFRVLDDDHATGESYSMTYVRNDDSEMRPATTAFRQWAFARVDGRWLIQSCKLRLVGSDDAPETITIR